MYQLNENETIRLFGFGRLNHANRMIWIIPEFPGMTWITYGLIFQSRF
jgi:hypothetical protein